MSTIRFGFRPINQGGGKGLSVRSAQGPRVWTGRHLLYG